LQFHTVFWISGIMGYDVSDVRQTESVALETNAFEIDMAGEKLER
jgi:hypothetical protein